MRQYLDFMRHVRDHGHRKADRTGTGTLSVFGYQMRFDLAPGFPLLTTKKVHLKSIIHELLWFLRGETNVASLQDSGVTIWDEWADANGELGPIYGYQWRSWPTPDGGHIDQIAQRAGADPAQSRFAPAHRIGLERRRHSADGAAAVPRVLPVLRRRRQALAASSTSAAPTSSSACRSTSRRYALLTHMVAQQCDLGVGDFVWTGGDCHLYLNHLEQVDLQLAREPRALPRLNIRRRRIRLPNTSSTTSRSLDYRPVPGDQGARRRVTRESGNRPRITGRSTEAPGSGIQN